MSISADKTFRDSASDLKVDNRVRTLRETAAAAGISLATLRRRITDGTGPRLTRMSQRRIGVTDRNREAWLAACEVDEPEAA